MKWDDGAMRTIDTNKLKSLGGEGAGPWRMDGGTLLRVRSGGRVIPTEECEIEELAQRIEVLSEMELLLYLRRHARRDKRSRRAPACAY